MVHLSHTDEGFHVEAADNCAGGDVGDIQRLETVSENSLLIVCHIPVARKKAISSLRKGFIQGSNFVSYNLIIDRTGLSR